MKAKRPRYKNEQEKLKNWYDKHSYWVFMKECAVCGSMFYTLFNNQVVCDCTACKTKLETVKQEKTYEL